MSYSMQVLESVRAILVKNLDFENPTLERALGVRWDVASDKFGIHISVKDKRPTRRAILSITSSIYDPLGFAARFLLPEKVILCRQRLGWDDEIPLKELHRWREWLDDLSKLGEYTIDRCIKPKAFGDVVTTELHHFSDASLIGYGAVSYLTIVNQREEIHCCLIMAKSRLAPIKPVTIPRMELSAAVLATRLDAMIRQELDCNINQSSFWTESTCVLRYIEIDKRSFQTFVSNRVAAIRDVSSPWQWQYMDSNCNPADDTSMGL